MALEDGTVVTGRSVGHVGETGGELCFNTSMSGYQEIMTDPSYYGQLMMMTYPHIGNYGTMDEDMEAERPMIAGLIVRAFSHQYSNASAKASLDDFMKQHELVGVSGIDTRTLVRHIRSSGVMNAVISSVELDDATLIERARNWPSMNGLELASHVTSKEAYDYCGSNGTRIAVYDYGVKLNILRMFEQFGSSVRVFPASTPLSTVLDWQPDGIFFSNGPGDPRAMPDSIETVRGAIDSGIPLFGICLGHQLMSLACGMNVYKMRVGHRGANHPVKYLATGHVEVTTQNHGFAVDAESIPEHEVALTHVNLNDHTVEGVRYKQFTGLSVQYHPEASPGPHDSRYLFRQFLEDVGNFKVAGITPASNNRLANKVSSGSNSTSVAIEL
jgi:carbamoyl-phosphate synthase small subunit